MQNKGISLTTTADKDMRFYFTYYFIFLFTFPSSLSTPLLPFLSSPLRTASPPWLLPSSRAMRTSWRSSSTTAPRARSASPRCTSPHGTTTRAPPPCCYRTTPTLMCSARCAPSFYVFLNVYSGSAMTMCREEKWIVMCFYECKKKKKCIKNLQLCPKLFITRVISLTLLLFSGDINRSSSSIFAFSLSRCVSSSVDWFHTSPYCSPL